MMGFVEFIIGSRVARTWGGTKGKTWAIQDSGDSCRENAKLYPHSRLSSPGSDRAIQYAAAS
ncbi:hypothetical protein, partial [Bradyrhizobium pachyrhizi]|uniref:hypothetical protein n=1 Tax=Bradyrhizobium pachyrhizi TaxID=280333 RepID=UPI001AEBF710